MNGLASAYNQSSVESVRSAPTAEDHSRSSPFTLRPRKSSNASTGRPIPKDSCNSSYNTNSDDDSQRPSSPGGYHRFWATTAPSSSNVTNIVALDTTVSPRTHSSSSDNNNALVSWHNRFGHHGPAATSQQQVNQTQLQLRPMSTGVPGIMGREHQSRILFVSLLESYCQSYDDDPLRNRRLFFAICRTLYSMGIIGKEYVDEMGSLRSTYSDAFRQLVVRAQESLDMYEHHDIESGIRSLVTGVAEESSTSSDEEEEEEDDDDGDDCSESDGRDGGVCENSNSDMSFDMDSSRDYRSVPRFRKSFSSQPTVYAPRGIRASSAQPGSISASPLYDSPWGRQQSQPSQRRRSLRATPISRESVSASPAATFGTMMMDARRSRYHDDFVQLRCLGKGGFGKVYEVRNKLDSRRYAVKLIKIKGEITAEKTLREIKTLASLDHPNIVRYYSSWIEITRWKSRPGTAATAGSNASRAGFGGIVSPSRSSNGRTSSPSFGGFGGMLPVGNVNCFDSNQKSAMDEVSIGHCNGPSCAWSPEDIVFETSTGGDKRCLPIQSDSEEEYDDNDSDDDGGDNASDDVDVDFDQSGDSSTSNTSGSGESDGTDEDEEGFDEIIFATNSEFEYQPKRPAKSVFPNITTDSDSSAGYSGRRSAGLSSSYSESQARSLPSQNLDFSAELVAETTLFVQMQLCQTTLQEFLNQRNTRIYDRQQKNDQSKNRSPLDVPGEVDGSWEAGSSYDSLVDPVMNVRLFRSIVEGVKYFHNRGVIHRDLKGANVFLDIVYIDSGGNPMSRSGSGIGRPEAQAGGGGGAAAGSGAQSSALSPFANGDGSSRKLVSSASVLGDVHADAWDAIDGGNLKERANGVAGGANVEDGVGGVAGSRKIDWDAVFESMQQSSGRAPTMAQAQGLSISAASSSSSRLPATRMPIARLQREASGIGMSAPMHPVPQITFIPRIGDFGLATKATLGLRTPATGTAAATSASVSNNSGDDGPANGTSMPLSSTAMPLCSSDYSWRTSNVGTITYAAPEQLREQQQQQNGYDEKADIYSLGIIFFELYYPFATAMERIVTIRQLREDGVFPPEFLQMWPREATLILRLMDPDPDKRPSAREILAMDLIDVPTLESAKLKREVQQLKHQLYLANQRNEELGLRVRELERIVDLSVRK
ncbi:hypothetical protein GGI07_003559 [Coemansia sp. Benny D115]|nr:hypothetical protein GGI07_003559 [Coemansia sp. Benny D115]